MTHEEAIQRLKEEINEYTPYAEKWDGARLDIEALSMAIQALEADVTDINVGKMADGDRAVSLNAVIKAVDKHTNDDGTLDDDISCILEDLPIISKLEGDYISRQDAIKAAVEAADDWDGGWNPTREGYITEALQALPSVLQAKLVNDSQDLDKDLDKGDYISRKALIKAMEEENAISFYEANEQSRETYYDLKAIVKNMPSVSQSKKGYWIKHLNSDKVLKIYQCSNCGNYQGYKQKFCEECGADMREDGDDNG